MSLIEFRPTLYTKQIKETIEFYVNNLKFDCIAYDEKWRWAALKMDNIELNISIPNEHTKFERPTFTGSLYIICDAVDELWLQFKDEAKVCYPIETFEYGMREFAIYDNNGYLLQFGQEI